MIDDIRFSKPVVKSTNGSVQVGGRFISVEEDLCVLYSSINDYFPGFTVMQSIFLPYLSETAKRAGFVPWPDTQNNADSDYFEDSTNLVDLFMDEMLFGGFDILEVDRNFTWSTPTLKYIRSMIGYRVSNIEFPPRVLEIRPKADPSIKTIYEYFGFLAPFQREIYAMAKHFDKKMPRLLFLHLVNKRVLFRNQQFDDYMKWISQQTQFNVRKDHSNVHHFSDKHMVNVFTPNIADTSNQYIGRGRAHQLTCCLGLKGKFWHYLVDAKILTFKEDDYFTHATWFYTAIFLRIFAQIIRARNRSLFREIPLPSKAAWIVLSNSNDERLHALTGLIFSSHIPKELIDNFTDSFGFENLNIWLDANIDKLQVYSKWSKDLALRCSLSTNLPYYMKPLNLIMGTL